MGHVSDMSVPSNPAIGQDWAKRAHDALEAAQKLPLGVERTDALRMADMLRDAASMFEFMKSVKREK